jgi:hypothetical protein
MICNQIFSSKLLKNKGNKFVQFISKKTGHSEAVLFDDPGSESFTKVRIEPRKVNAGSVLEFEVVENSGLAVHFRKI